MKGTTLKYSKLFSTLSLLVLLAWSFNSHANKEDWGLVKRFNSQMELAQSGNATAMYEVGRMYQRGRGVDVDINSAIIWYKKAAENKQINAMAQLGILYYEGKDVKRDRKRAFKYFIEAAKGDEPSACYYLGIAYEKGHGVSRNVQLAIRWYKKAKSVGHYQADNRLKALQAQNNTPSTASTPPNTKKDTRPAKKDVPEILLSSNWLVNGKPAAYLRSDITQCKQNSKGNILCKSSQQTRRTRFEEISYVTITTIDNFKAGNKFTIHYHHKVISTEKLQTEVISWEDGDDEKSDDDSEENTEQAVTAQQQRLPYEKKHVIECKLNRKGGLDCVKNKSKRLKITKEK